MVESWSEVQDRFAPASVLWLARSRRSVQVLRSRPHRGRLLVTLAGVDDRDGAEALRGAVLEVPRARVPAAPEGSYYHFDLLGCRFEDRVLGPLGTVEQVIEDGGGLLLRIDAGDRRLLVPFVRAYLERIDVEAKEIVARLPPGLVETCASTS